LLWIGSTGRMASGFTLVEYAPCSVAVVAIGHAGEEERLPKWVQLTSIAQ
jgi:hypothetical protein